MKWLSCTEKCQSDITLGAPDRVGEERVAGQSGSESCCYDAFGLIATALSKKISVFQSSSLKVVPISPNVS